MIRHILSVALFFTSTALLVPHPATAQTGPQPQHEFRAAWVATVSNIDWPSTRNLSTADQKKEMLAILDQAVEMNLNAIVFQVRPMCDALYKSSYEPWSEFLTGTMGKAPSPYYDPLEFVIEECHKRGLELHAWFNPYRALTPSIKSKIPDNHVSKRNPDIVRTIGKYLWLDPTEEQTKNYTLNVILDVIRRYDVDGVHLDDYFYPYSSYNGGKDFPDDANWNEYKKDGGRLSRNDWRRDHVNDFVERLYKLVKQEDIRVKVGISPFGIWRPNHPEGIQGLDQYDSLYADPKLWLNEGWIDYLTPQLYWPIDQKPQAYKRLLAWWVSENKQNRHIWPGNYTSRINNTAKSWSVSEIVNQIEATRDQRGAGGNIHFSMDGLMQNRKNITTILKEGVYAEPALIPPSPWLGNQPPSAPRGAVRREGPGDVVVTWASPVGEDVRRWAIYSNHGGQWKTHIVPAYKTIEGTLRIPGSEKATDIAISAIDRLGNESERTLLRVR